jgi:hypothetical protein
MFGPYIRQERLVGQRMGHRIDTNGLLPRQSWVLVDSIRHVFKTILGNMIYLVGVEHLKTQWIDEYGTNTGFVSLFINSLKEDVKELKVEIIAEELSEDVLARYNVSKLSSSAYQIAREYKIEHIFCDPTLSEREDLSIPAPPYTSEENRKTDFQKRERFWLNKIIYLEDKPVVFICGRNHVESFGHLLEGNGFRVTVLSKYLSWP